MSVSGIKEMTEAALRENEERLQRIIADAPFGAHLYRLEPGGKLIFVGANRAADRILKTENRRFAGKTIEEAFPALGTTGIPDAYRQVASTGRSFEQEQITYGEQGISGAFQIFAFQTAPDRMAVFFTDITERKKAEEALRESEERFKLFFSRSPVGLAIIDRDMRLVTVNDYLAAYSGVPAQALAGKTIREAQGQKADLLEPLIREVFDTGKPIINYGTALPVGSGKEVYFESSFFPLSGAEGRVVNVGVITVDLTERKRMENELQRNQRFVERILTTTPNYIYIIDLDRRMNVFSNVNIMQLLGYSSWNMPLTEFRLFKDLLYPDDREKLVRHFARMRHAREGEVVETEYRMRHADGTWRWVRSRDAVFARAPDGRVTQIIGIGIDITERRQAGARLETAVHRAEQRAREAEEGKSTLDTLMQNVPEGILIVEAPDGRVRRISRYGRDFIGLERGEAQGMGVRRILDRIEIAADGSHETGLALLLSVLSEGTEVIGREFTLGVNGRRLVVLTNAGPIRDKEGRITGAVFTWRDITERKQDQERLKQSFGKLEKVTNGIIASISRVVEMRDPYTAGHQRRVGQLAHAMAKELGFSTDRSNGIKIAGQIHDIGKLNVPAEILSKPGRLSTTEFEIIKIHPQAGYDILRFIDFPWPVAEVAYQHQERLNGSGYPRQLKGDEILPETKVVSVADTVEAMTFPRPYRPLVGLDKALAEIGSHRGTLYDDDAVEACIRLFREKKFVFEK